MNILKTHLKTESEDYQRHHKKMRERIQEFNAILKTIEAGGGTTLQKKHTSRGKLLPRDRIATLIDPRLRIFRVFPICCLSNVWRRDTCSRYHYWNWKNITVWNASSL